MRQGSMEALYERLMNEPAPKMWRCSGDNSCGWEGNKYKEVKLKFKHKTIGPKKRCPHCGELVSYTSMYVFWTTAQQMKKDRA